MQQEDEMRFKDLVTGSWHVRKRPERSCVVIPQILQGVVDAAVIGDRRYFTQLTLYYHITPALERGRWCHSHLSRDRNHLEFIAVEFSSMVWTHSWRHFGICGLTAAAFLLQVNEFSVIIQSFSCSASRRTLRILSVRFWIHKKKF